MKTVIFFAFMAVWAMAAALWCAIHLQWIFSVGNLAATVANALIARRYFRKL